MNEHFIVPSLLRDKVDVVLVGAGGSGSHMLSGLVRLHRAMLALGHPGGLNVTVCDPDNVSEANVGRQLFYPSDVGCNKAQVLVHRVNLSCGLAWQAEPVRYGIHHDLNRSDLVIGCVDSAKARRSIANAANDVIYWLDLGNAADTGQVILGQPTITRRGYSADAWTPDNTPEAKARRAHLEARRLPTVLEIFPDLADEKRREVNTPSCSLAEALDKQSLFVNQHVATWALELLWRLFRYGKITHHGAFINLETGRVNPLPVPTPRPELPRGKKLRKQ